MSLHPYRFRQPAEVENLKALLAEGCSYSEIGLRLKMTRCAVGAVIFRLKAAGIELPPTPPRWAPRAKTPKVVVKAIIEVATTVVPIIRPRDLPVEISSTAVSLVELGDDACHWPVSGAGRDTMYCGADRNGSSHDSYCRHHAARSIRVVEVVPFRPKVMAAAW
jgi:hypothetical protein